MNLQEITTGLAVSDDGIWRTEKPQGVSYPASGHSACFAVEETSFWFNHRNDCIRALVHRFGPTPGKPMLDVGGGNGYVSLGLAQSGVDVILVEPGETGATNAKWRGLEHVVCSTTDAAGFVPGSIGAIGLFDVIEHIEEDHAFMAEMSDLLTSGDRLYATVPAHQWLWSAEDVKAGHHRRYSLDQFTTLLRGVDLEIEYASYFFRPLPVPVFAARVVPFRLRAVLDRTDEIGGAPDIGPQHDIEPSTTVSTRRSHAANAGTVSGAVRRILRPEVKRIANDATMRFGGSLIVAARRR